jgi:XTP/dITP diphosphohydrolase
MTLYFATGNAHKAQELSAILMPHSIRTPVDEGLCFEPEETGATFLENALIKAKALYALIHAPVIADDSGLVIDALDGRPGVYSARYGARDGKLLTSQEKNALILHEMEGKTDRRARFVCSMALYQGPERLIVAQETLEGEIARAPSGTNGFGYDPIFYLPSQACCLADLSEADKNRISHRGKAAALLKKLLG